MTSWRWPGGWADGGSGGASLLVVRVGLLLLLIFFCVLSSAASSWGLSGGRFSSLVADSGFGLGGAWRPFACPGAHFSSVMRGGALASRATEGRSGADLGLCRFGSISGTGVPGVGVETKRR